jgi:hypothetical protein
MGRVVLKRYFEAHPLYKSLIVYIGCMYVKVVGEYNGKK